MSDTNIETAIKFVSQFYEKYIEYFSKKPQSEDEEMLRNLILARCERIRAKIINGDPVALIEPYLNDIYEYEKQYAISDVDAEFDNVDIEFDNVDLDLSYAEYKQKKIEDAMDQNDA